MDALLSSNGVGFRRIALANSASTAGDTLVALALAGTLFFAVPSAEARTNVALYLVLTLAPFAVLAPALGALLRRSPVAYRHGLVGSGVLRAVAAVIMAIEIDGLLLYPLAFILLVLSRLFAISRASVLPASVDGATPLVFANARLAQLGVAAGALVVPIGALIIRLLGSGAVLMVAAVAFTTVAFIGRRVAHPVPAPAPGGGRAQSVKLPQPIRFAQLATAGVRLLNGFLLLLLAFALHSTEASVLDVGALLAAGGAGYLIAAIVAPWLDRRLREEPMVVSALALEAAAAFIAALAFGLVAAAALAAAAGLAWGTARFAFDGLLQAALPGEARGLAFTRAETLFAIAWVLGAIIPTAVPVPAALGLAAAGVAALTAQVIYVAALLVPRRAEPAGGPSTPP